MEGKGKVNAGYEPDKGEPDEKIPNGSTAPEKGGALALDDKDLFVAQKEEKEDSKSSEEKPVEEKYPSVGLFQLFRYTSCCDRVIIVFAALVAMLSGTSMPAIMVLFGGVVDKLVLFDKARKNGTVNETMLAEFLETTGSLNLYISMCGVGFFICNYIYVTCFSLTAANQALRIRCRFMQAMLKQDMAWYDTHKTGDFAARITGDLTRIQEGINEKVGICLSFLSATLLCVICGIYYGWKLALVILCVTPVLTVAMAIMSKIQASVTNEEMEAYGAAGAVAEEVFSSIRTVVAFAGQRKEIERYERCLVPARKKGVKRGMMTALGGALTWLCIFAGYALAFWYGVKLILEGIGQENPEYTGGKLIIIFFNVMSASMFIGQTAPYFEAFALARGAAAKIYSIIDRVPVIDGSSQIGLRPNSLDGHISLKDVHFNYPSRLTVPILRGLNLEAKPGETVALVGSSGSGKSTIVQLLLRFYDTLQGSVELDGVNIRALNVGWLRDQVGLVGQEPVLFSTTIEENIRMGRRDATHEEVVRAAETANARHFIEALPKKYETEVGERGTQLSGGQKQRIAIARALVKNPRILLLDEATSALDTESEATVQAALDQARLGRTTIVVAHRLSTIRTADKIVALEGGVVKETGTHDELMKAKGLYYQLVVAQTKDEDDNDDDKEEEVELPILARQISAISAASDDPPKYGLDRQVSTMSNAKGAQEDDDEEVDKTGLTSRLLKICAPEWPYALVGGIAALAMGVHFPAYGILFGAILGVLSQDKEVIEEENSFYCLLFVGLAITSFICGFLQTFLFSVAGEKLTFRLRKMVFANIITQDISFFDDTKNAVGALCTRLNSDASSVQGATGSRIATALQALSTFVVAIFIAFNYNWKVGLVCLVFVPLVLVGALLEAKVVSGHMQKEKKGMEKAAKVATEAIDSIRTVVSLHQEQTFYNLYYNALLEPHKKSRLKSHVRGLAYGYAQAITAFAYAATQYYGCLLVSKGEVEYSDVMKIVEGVLISGMTMGQTVAFTPDYEKARVAAVRIFRLLDMRPVIDAFSTQGTSKPSIEGRVDLDGVHFRYPNRPQVRVLRGLSAAVQPGQTVALVGSSGCGKSTCIQLLERFYDPCRGAVLVDSEDVRSLNVSDHRSHLALVSQEPALFDRSIAENIAYGDNARAVDMAEIVAAARQANIHTFVTGLPQGYETPVGGRGAQLSGGQKQRIAIARALVRNPRILLLDEATSALDTESEKVVQEALDLARSGRSCLVIAHRLSTVQNADLILVLHRGRIVEKGTHQELINKKGIYYGLHNTQG